MAITEYYVDPSIDANSGTGTIGDPFGDLQYALDTVTRDSTNGDRFNIKDSAAEVLTSAISLATYGTPGFNARLVFQGYTSTAGDGGMGILDGATNSVAIFSDATAAGRYISFVNLDLQGHSSGNVILTDDECGLYYCKVSGASNAAQIHFDQGCHIIGCEFNCEYYGFDINNYCTVVGNYFSGFASGSFGAAGAVPGDCFVAFNIVSKGADTGGNGFLVQSTRNRIFHNSILGASATGYGIRVQQRANAICGNIVEGFSGTGGHGYIFDANQDPMWYEGNAAYNNDTNYGSLTDEYAYQNDNEVLSVSGFAKSGSDTFSNRFTYYAPVDTGNIFAGSGTYAYNLTKGAVQSSVSGGGGGSPVTVGYGGS